MSPRARSADQEHESTTSTALQGIGIFTVSAWATQIAAMEGNGLSAGVYTRPLFLTIAVTMWSLRLGGFLFYRIVEMGNDKCDITSFEVLSAPWSPRLVPLHDVTCTL
jgi:steroid 5-alpha reductase family enzyme